MDLTCTIQCIEHSNQKKSKFAYRAKTMPCISQWGCVKTWHWFFHGQAGQAVYCVYTSVLVYFMLSLYYHAANDSLTVCMILIPFLVLISHIYFLSFCTFC